MGRAIRQYRQGTVVATHLADIVGSLPKPRFVDAQSSDTRPGTH